MTSQCHHEMRPVSLINDAQIIERILRHVGSGGIDRWVNEILNHGVCIAPWLDDQMPDYDCGL